MKSFEFNKLFILQSLSPEDMVNGYAEPNTKLMETIDSVKKHNCKLSYFNYELITINGGKSQFENIIARIVDQCSSKNVYPMIHFLGHGEQDQGVFIWNDKKKNDDCIIWKELFYQLAKVNKACHNNLFFTTTACHGFDSFKALFIYELPVIPIVGIIAIDPKDDFYVDDADVIFCQFYKTLLETRSIINAFTATKALEPKLIGKLPYIAFSDDWFVHVYKNVLKLNSPYSTSNIAKHIETVAIELKLSDEEKNNLFANYMGDVESYKQLDYIAIRDKLFMLNDPMVKRERFNLPDSI